MEVQQLLESLQHKVVALETRLESLQSVVQDQLMLVVKGLINHKLDEVIKLQKNNYKELQEEQDLYQNLLSACTSVSISSTTATVTSSKKHHEPETPSCISISSEEVINVRMDPPEFDLLGCDANQEEQQQVNDTQGDGSGIYSGSGNNIIHNNNNDHNNEEFLDHHHHNNINKVVKLEAESLAASDDDDVNYVNVNNFEQESYLEMGQLKVEDVEIDPLSQVNVVVDDTKGVVVKGKSIKRRRSFYPTGKSCIVGPADISYTQSRRGAPQIIIHGYTYYNNKVRASCSSTYWNCVDMVKLRCPAKVILKSAEEGGVTRKAHNHCLNARGVQPTKSSTTMGFAKLGRKKKVKVRRSTVPISTTNIPPSDMHYTTSRLGNPQILIHGFTYYKNNTSSNQQTTYWNCVNMINKKYKCPARFVRKEGEEGGQVRYVHNHHHSERTSSTEASSSMNNVRKRRRRKIQPTTTSLTTPKECFVKMIKMDE